MSALKFLYTIHACDVLTSRHIERTWVELTVNAPDEVEIDVQHPERRRAYRAIPERGGRILRVVYAGDGDTVRIVTVFFDRGRRRARRASQVRP